MAIDDVVNAMPAACKMPKSERSSTDDDYDSEPSPATAPSTSTIGDQVRDLQTMLDDMDKQPSTMWLGMEDGYVHIYNCTNNIRIKNTKIKIPHPTSVFGIT